MRQEYFLIFRTLLNCLKCIIYEDCYSGNSILSGDNCKIEGSIVVLFMNLILMFGFVMAKKKRDKNL